MRTCRDCSETKPLADFTPIRGTRYTHTRCKPCRAALARAQREHGGQLQPPPPGSTECVRPAAGTGVLNYPLYLRLLRQSGYNGGLIMHSLTAADLPALRV